jgi:hypothetical protein
MIAEGIQLTLGNLANHVITQAIGQLDEEERQDVNSLIRIAMEKFPSHSESVFDDTLGGEAEPARRLSLLAVLGVSMLTVAFMLQLAG